MDKQLSDNIQSQTKRLVQQLKELEELKDEFEPEEYDEIKQDTFDQLKEFEKGLEDMKKNNLSLNDEINKAKLELINACKSVFNKDSIKQTLVIKEAESLREQVKGFERDVNLGKMKQEVYINKKVEIINNLKYELLQELTEEENKFLETHTGKGQFKQQTDDQEHGEDQLNLATQQLKKL